MRAAGLSLLLLALAACAPGYGADVVPIGPSATASCSPEGLWSVKHRGTVVIEELGIAVWDGAGNFAGQKDSPRPKIHSLQDRRSAEGTLGTDLLRYRMFASPCDRGIHFRWHQADTTTNTWAVVIKLSRTLFSNVDFILDGQHTHTFPAEQKKAARFFTGNAQSLLTAQTEGGRLFLDCAERYGMVAQDARAWGDDSYHVLIYPKNGEVSFLLSVTSLHAGPAILHAFENAPSVERFSRFELTMDLWARFANPYDERDIRVCAEITKPSGRSVTVDGFFYREYLRSTADGKETFEPAGDPSWKIRFTPDEIGEHTYSVSVRTARGTSSPLKGRFTATESSRNGFLRIASGGKSFAFSNGTPYFAIGHNLCWTSEETPMADFDAYLRKMAQAGENFSRIWFCSWGIGQETDKLDELDLADAWILDHVTQSAEERGIFFKLCLENFWDFTREKKSPYWTSRGGFCAETRDYFAKAQSREWAKRKYRYAVARWGYSPAVLAWELWNEVDYTIPDRPLILEWSKEMASYLRSIDPYEHLITSSLGVNNVWDDLWSMREMDFVQIHSYIHRLGNQVSRSELDAAELVRLQAAHVNRFEKPFLISEFGFLVTKDDPGMNDVDTTGIHLHNALWSSALSGASGTCMSWWWDSYIEKHDLYHHYSALAKFLRGEEGRIPALTHVYGAGPTYRVTGLRNEEGGLFWMQNKNNTWYHCAAKGERRRPLQGAVLKLSGLKPGRYVIEWWDTYNGGVITDYDKTVGSDGVLKVRAPSSASDVGCKVRLVPAD